VLPFSRFLLFSGTQERSCVTIFTLFTLFGHARAVLRYHPHAFYSFRAPERGLALPFSRFLLFSGTQEGSCVSIFTLFTLFGHARGVLRFRFHAFYFFRARNKVLCYHSSPLYIQSTAPSTLKYKRAMSWETPGAIG
jgi:hypothetical protein